MISTHSSLWTGHSPARHYQVQHVFRLGQISLGLRGPGIEAIYGPQQECYAYFDPANLTSIRTALDDLQAYIEVDGPFDGIVGYSQGAAIAATLLLQDKIDHPSQLEPLCKCAVFLSGGVPFDPAALRRGGTRFLDPAVDGEPIAIPTAHIWGSNDLDFPDTSPKLSKLCAADRRTEIVHHGGHEIPALKGAFLENVVNAFHEIVTMALSVQ